MLKHSGLGCHIGTNCISAVEYADDIALIAPSVTPLKKMLHICDRFGGSYDVTFNVSMYQLIPYINNRDEFNDIYHNDFLCQLTCQSADIMSSLCGIGVRVRVNNFSSKTIMPRDMLFILKRYLIYRG